MIAKRPRVLSIAGVDPSGGAGIIADIKSITAFGGYAMAAIAAITAQNTKGVSEVELVDSKLLYAQLETISNDIHIDAIKIGLLSEDAIETVKRWLDSLKNTQKLPKFIVLDPVMVATSGDRLISECAEQKLKQLCEFASIVTPNLPELAVWTGNSLAKTENEAISQAKQLFIEFQNSFNRNVIIYLKLGHLEQSNNQNEAKDFIVTNETSMPIAVCSPWVKTTNTHGTGCSLSSALATNLVHFAGDTLQSATLSKYWLTLGLKNGQLLGVGGEDHTDKRTAHGPIDHLSELCGTKFMDYANLLTFDIVDKIDSMKFINSLADATLEKSDFAQYLVQDSIYLTQYMRIALEMAEFAPDEETQSFIHTLAGDNCNYEIDFHNKWLELNGFANLSGIHFESISQTTEKYIDILQKALETKNFAIILASLMPCAYLYSQIGQKLLEKVKKSNVDINKHPYKAWILAYSDSSYCDVVDKLVDMINAVAENVSCETWHEMIKYYRALSIEEFNFFEQIEK